MSFTSKNIEFLLKKYDLDASNLDKILGFGKGKISHYKVNDKSMPIKAAMSICEYFKITLDDFYKMDLSNNISFSLKKNDMGTPFITNDNATITHLTANEKDLYERIIREKDKEIEYLRKLLEKKI
jgi:hypothetical protein